MGNKRPGIGILGVDPGTVVVGYAMIWARGPGDFDYLECGVLRSRAKDINLRIFEIARDLAAIIEEFRPREMAIESAFTGPNAASALRIGESRGAYKLAAAQAGLQVFEYAPARVKRAVAGRGHATKAEIQHRVGILCGLQKRPVADAADAVALAICHAQFRDGLYNDSESVDHPLR